MRTEKMSKLAAMGALALLAGVVHAGPAAKAAAPAQAAATSPGKSQQFDDWTHRCGTPAGGKEVCEIVQVASVNPQTDAQGQKGEAQWLLQTLVAHLDGQERPSLVMKTRLGVILPPGITIALAGSQPLTMPYRTCDQSGCTAVSQLEPAHIEAMKRAEEAAMKDPEARSVATIALMNNTPQGAQVQGVSLPFSLKGFTKAFGALKPASAPAPAAKADDKKGKKDSGKKK
jgi:invasion protein IalB